MTAGGLGPIQPLRMRPAWKALEEHHRTLRDVHLRQIFADDPRRGTRLTAKGAGLYLDYSKHRVTDETLRLLLELAGDRGLAGRIGAMFTGRKINGVELGKALAQRIGGELQGGGPLADGHDSSTVTLMRRYVQARNGSAK